MGADLVRVCPACGAHNRADRLRCDCGALLFGVDLVRPVAPDADAPAPPHEPPASAAPAATVRCPYEDCGQLNPAGSPLCLYCNRPLQAPDAGAAAASDSAPALLQLPSALRDRYRVLRTFETRGAEADILLVQPSQGDEPRVAKIYRQGILPSAEVQARIARIDPRHCVRLYETGLSDGRAYEVMEYCPIGSLRQHMDGRPQSAAFIIDVIRELAAALHAVHAAGLVHRDLKPANVLLRSAQPLDLALTDFSTASAMDATQLFTGMARTLLYAAPEALSGVLDAKADYWALGMLLLELATGAHPFRGLSDAVILYQLTTRAMDLSGVADARLRQLLGGLLLRDPKRRWGAREIGRWLAGDESLPNPVEPGVAPGFAQPYTVLGERCTTPEQLAVAFARHWQAGVEDLANGQLLRWFTEVQKDQDAARLLLTLRYEGRLSLDEQLLRFILHFAPGIPPIWRGRSVELPALLTLANQALQGDQAAADDLVRLYEDRVLDAYAAAGNPQAAELSQRWRGAAESFDAAWTACLALLRNRQAPSQRAPGVMLYDALVYGQHAGADPVRPPPAALYPRFLAIAYDPGWAERLRGRLLRELSALAAQCPWLTTLGDPQAMTPAQLLACEALLPEARKIARQRAQDEAQRQQQQAQERSELHAALQANLTQVAEQAREITWLFAQPGSLRQALDEYANLLARIRAQDGADDQWLAVRRLALGSESAMRRLRILCDQLTEHLAANAGWFSSQVAVFALVLLFLSMRFFRTWGLLLILAVGMAAAAWRLLPVLKMVQDIHALGREIGSLGRRLKSRDAVSRGSA